MPLTAKQQVSALASVALLDAYTVFVLARQTMRFYRFTAGTFLIQALLGHADLTMVEHYAQMVDDGLLQAHRQFSPVDRLRWL